MELLQAYHLAGYIRELQNVIERGVILAEAGMLRNQTRVCSRSRTYEKYLYGRAKRN